MQFRALLLGAALCTATAAAQPPGPPHGPDIERLAVLLDLDAYQKGEVERVLEEQRAARHAQREELRASGERPSFEEMQARREQQRAETLGRLETVLSEQQLTKLKLLMEPASRGGPGRRAGRGL